MEILSIFLEFYLEFPGFSCHIVLGLALRLYHPWSSPLSRPGSIFFSWLFCQFVYSGNWNNCSDLNGPVCTWSKDAPGGDAFNPDVDHYDINVTVHNDLGSQHTTKHLIINQIGNLLVPKTEHIEETSATKHYISFGIVM